jgi:ADP-heptose:LPS heptosyltransferase
MCGRLTVAELADVVRGASLVIANESGTIHMAAYFRVPSVAVLGGGHYGWFVPYPERCTDLVPPRTVSLRMACFGCNWQCRYRVPKGSAVPCIEGLTIDAVWAAVSDVLGSIGAVNSNLNVVQGKS